MPTEAHTALDAAQAFQARRVYLALYDNTESFETIGVSVAYLLGAILTGDAVDLSDEVRYSDFIHVMRDTFEPFDHVWDYVILPSL